MHYYIVGETRASRYRLDVIVRKDVDTIIMIIIIWHFPLWTPSVTTRAHSNNKCFFDLWAVENNLKKNPKFGYEKRAYSHVGHKIITMLITHYNNTL